MLRVCSHPHPEHANGVLVYGVTHEPSNTSGYWIPPKRTHGLCTEHQGASNAEIQARKEARR